MRIRETKELANTKNPSKFIFIALWQSKINFFLEGVYQFKDNLWEKINGEVEDL